MKRKGLYQKSLVLSLAVLAAVGVCSLGAVAAEGESAVTYPLETDETLTYWITLNGVLVAPNYSSFNDTEFSKYLEEETGVHVEYLSPAVGNEQQEFSLMVASGDMPDIIDYDWNKGRYPGGPEAALQNNVIVPLNDYLPEYAPDMLAIFEENPEYDKSVKTDSGTYYGFPVMKLDPYLTTTYGLVLRGDWLEELGLDVPVTIDDWHTVLTAFKEQKGAQFPLSYANPGAIFNPFANGMFTGAFGITKNWYLQDGQITYGAYEPGYKDWLKTMAQWYAEGLLDPNFATNDGATIDSHILNGETGATSLWIGSGLGKYLPALREDNPDATLIPAPYPVLNEGDTPQFNSLLNAYDGQCAAITSSCKNVELAVQFLNYGYTEKGRKTYNYGREGISYEYGEDGQVYLTDLVTASPDGWPIGQAWSKYARGVYPGPYFSERRFLELYYTYPEQLECLEQWTKPTMQEHLVPPISPTQDESSEYSQIMTDVEAAVDEYTLTAIMGTVDIDASYDGYIEQLKDMGMDRAIEIQQNALDRYNSR